MVARHARAIALLLVAALPALPLSALQATGPTEAECAAPAEPPAHHGDHQPAPAEHPPCPDCAQDRCAVMPSCVATTPALGVTGRVTLGSPLADQPSVASLVTARSRAPQPPTPPPQAS